MYMDIYKVYFISLFGEKCQINTTLSPRHVSLLVKEAPPLLRIDSSSSF